MDPGGALELFLEERGKYIRCQVITPPLYPAVHSGGSGSCAGICCTTRFRFFGVLIQDPLSGTGVLMRTPPQVQFLELSGDPSQNFDDPLEKAENIKNQRVRPSRAQNRILREKLVNMH